MAFSRYAFTPNIRNDLGQSFKMTTKLNVRIRKAVTSGQISFNTHTIQEGERLDSLSQLAYGSSEYWWVIAAASAIGWSLQVPPGTLLQIPTSLSDVMRFLR